MNPMKIYTRKGDAGTCGLFGGTRVDKDDPRVECYGTFDEVNATIGLLRARLGLEHPWQERLQRIQRDLMDMMSHLARPSDCAKENPNPLPEEGVGFCEAWIDEIENTLDEKSNSFLLPGGSESAALCHVLRTQVRRAERRLATLMKLDSVHSSIPAFTNRLSDLFFALSRAANAEANISDEKWNLFLYKARKNQEKD